MRAIVFLLLLGIHAATARAVEKVTVRRERDDVVQELSGSILDYDRTQLILQNGDQERAIPADTIVGIEADWGSDHVQARQYAKAGKWENAIEGYARARRQERRGWAQQEILRDLAFAYRAHGDVERAGDVALTLIGDFPRTRAVDALPLAWTASPPDPALARQARVWLADQRSPPARLLGASWLLSGSTRSQALGVLQELSRESEAWLAQLATAQTWRVACAGDANRMSTLGKNDRDDAGIVTCWAIIPFGPGVAATGRESACGTDVYENSGLALRSRITGCCSVDVGRRTPQPSGRDVGRGELVSGDRVAISIHQTGGRGSPFVRQSESGTGRSENWRLDVGEQKLKHLQRVISLSGILAGTAAACHGQTGVAASANPAPGGNNAPADPGLFEIVFAGGWVGFLIIMLLLALSMTAAYLVFEHLMTIRSSELMPPGLDANVRELLTQGQLAEAESACRNRPSFLSFVILHGLSEIGGGWSAVEKALEDATAEQSARLFRKIEYLSVIGNIAPMVGLLGTVTGMILAFQRVATTQGAAGAAELAEGIYQALVTTVGGLIVAIPSLGAFAIFRNRVDQLAAETAYAAQHVFAPLKRRPREQNPQRLPLRQPGGK